MQPEDVLIGIMIEYTLLQRREQCIGCNYAIGVQKRHLLCLIREY